MSKLPEIRIFYAGLLERESVILAKSYASEIENYEEAERKVELYRKEWYKYEHRLVQFITNTLELEFYKPVIDVHIAQKFIPKSAPLIIDLQYSPDQFLDILTHELIHVLLTDNKLIQINGKHIGHRIADRWYKLLSKDHSFTTLIHIPVHAVMAKVFTEFYHDDKRKVRDIKTTESYGLVDYQKSWDFVEKNGYQKIVDLFKEDYKNFAEELVGTR